MGPRSLSFRNRFSRRKLYPSISQRLKERERASRTLFTWKRCYKIRSYKHKKAQLLIQYSAKPRLTSSQPTPCIPAKLARLIYSNIPWIHLPRVWQYIGVRRDLVSLPKIGNRNAKYILLPSKKRWYARVNDSWNVFLARDRYLFKCESYWSDWLEKCAHMPLALRHDWRRYGRHETCSSYLLLPMPMSNRS